MLTTLVEQFINMTWSLKAWKEPWDEDNSRQKDNKCKGPEVGLSPGLVQEYPVCPVCLKQ